MRVALLVLLLVWPRLSAGAAEVPGRRPNLIVIVVVDQLRAGYLDHFSPWMSEQGFKRLAREGATFRNARFRHAVASTAPGHAAIGGGLVPAESGIAGNKWFERDAPVDVKAWEWYFDDIYPYRAPHIQSTPFTAEGDWWWKSGGTPRYCTYDDEVQPAAGNTVGMSPVALRGSSLGDRLKEHYPQARVVSVALKELSAILVAGRRADAAYWFDNGVRGFISSTYYRSNPKVFAFNELVPGYFPASARWTPSPHIPAGDLSRATFDPPAAWPLKNTTYGGTFPHPIQNARALTYTPFAHELLLDFAQHVLVTENLGMRDETPDLFCISISSTDNIGHYYGPDSMEVADSIVRLDRTLAHFLDAVERRFGDRVVVALTSDHGVQATPEIVKLRDPKADAGRIDVRNPDAKARRIADLPPQRIVLERELARRLGIRFDVRAPLSHALVYFWEESGFWIHWRRVTTLGLDHERVKGALRDILLQMEGISDAWTNTELLASNPNASEREQLMRAAFIADRSGDVRVALRDGWIWHWGSNSTTHGQPLDADLHVPLILWGHGIRTGVYEGEASPTDLARTLGALVEVDAGGRESRLLPGVE